MLRVNVYGTPAPQGSKKFMGMTKGAKPHAILKESSDKVVPWRESVRAAAYQARQTGCVPTLEGPVGVSMVFTVRRPKTAAKTRTHPDVQPDLDKLARSTCDALTEAGIWRDDGQVVEFFRLAKVYVGSLDPDALDLPGVKIEVYAKGDYRWVKPS